jgi:nucleotide-binding universal stress UspA family protein
VLAVIATDGSDDAIAAARQGLELLDPAAAVVLVCVVEPPAEATSGLQSGFAGGVVEPAALDGAWVAAFEGGEASLARTRAGLPADREIETAVESGSPGPTLCQVAEDRGADVIVVGSRGHGALKRALLGSVSSHVLHHAPCPVLVLRKA